MLITGSIVQRILLSVLRRKHNQPPHPMRFLSTVLIITSLLLIVNAKICYGKMWKCVTGCKHVCVCLLWACMNVQSVCTSQCHAPPLPGRINQMSKDHPTQTVDRLCLNQEAMNELTICTVCLWSQGWKYSIVLTAMADQLYFTDQNTL